MERHTEGVKMEERDAVTSEGEEERADTERTSAISQFQSSALSHLTQGASTYYCEFPSTIFLQCS